MAGCLGLNSWFACHSRLGRVLRTYRGGMLPIDLLVVAADVARANCMRRGDPSNRTCRSSAAVPAFRSWWSERSGADRDRISLRSFSISPSPIGATLKPLQPAPFWGERAEVTKATSLMETTRPEGGQELESPVGSENPTAAWYWRRRCAYSTGANGG